MYYCPFCIHMYPTSNHLIAHIKFRHSAQVYERFECKQPKCWRSFSNISTYNKHLGLKHPLSANTSTMPMPSKRNNVKPPLSDTDLPDFSNHSPVKETISNTGNVERCITVAEFKELVHDGCACFVSKLYANNSINRSVVQEIIENVNELFSLSCIHIMKQKYNSNASNTIDNDLNQMFDILINAFENLRTEYQRFNFFDGCDTFVKPIKFIIGTSLEPKTVKGATNLNVVDLCGQFIPIGQVLHKFLSLPNVFAEIISYMDKLKIDEMFSFVRTELWMKTEQRFQNEGKLVLPLTIYFDDFEVNNPLGSHKGINKLGAVYFTIGALPPQYSSQLENIFLAQLHNSEDQKSFGNRNVFRKLLYEITSLEKSGITLELDTGKKQVYFVLTRILGDNLGLHSILGFNESFNANYTCRFCRVDKNTLQNQISEDAGMLRTKENYAEDSLRCEYGIKQNCIFHDIPSYHLIDSPTADIAHDYLEGVCRYDMARISNALITNDKLFSVDQLNNRIRYFNYGSAVVGNIPPAITRDALKNGVIIISASEMLCLVYYFGLIIGDLVPPDNKVWQLYIALRQIISLAMTQSLHKEDAKLLRTLASEHHSLYLQIFKDSLKPKHHFMVHHGTTIEKCGPLHDMSTIRYEGRHQGFKQNAKVTVSRKNISYTLALKNQLSLNYRFMAKKGLGKRITMGTSFEIDLTALDDYNSFENILPANSNSNDKYLCVSWVNINGITYKPGNVVVSGTSNDCLQFGQIKYILVDEMQEVHFIFLCLDNLRFVKHIHAFEIAITNKWNYISHKNLHTHITYNVHVLANGKCYVPRD